MIENITIKSWAEDDRPREKLLLKGKHNLSNSELIAIILGSGSREQSAVELARELLSSVSNNLSLLGKLTHNELTKFKGIGDAKAISILAALEIGRRRKEN
jgi:DNA repair protein RadC